MPQMAPIWWTTMFLTFILTYITMMMLLYFYNNYINKNMMNKTSKKSMNINWKW